MTARRRTSRVGAGALLALAAACDLPEFVPPGGPPEIRRFEAAPFEVEAGAPVRIAWQVLDADAVRLEGLEPEPRVLAPEGTLEFTPTTSLELTLVAENPAGATRARAQVSLRTDLPARIVAFDVAPPRARPGTPVELRWITEHATAVRVRAAAGPAIEVPPIGSLVFRPSEDTEVSLTAEGATGAVTATRAVALVPQTPAILSFAAIPDFGSPTTPAQLSATVDGFDRLTFWEQRPGGDVLLDEILRTGSSSFGPPRVSVNLGTRPAGRHRFTLVLEGQGMTLEESTELAIVTSEPPTIDMLTVTPTITGRGGDVVVQWRTRDALHVRLRLPASGNLTVGRSGILVWPAQASGLISLTATGMNAPAASAGQTFELDPNRPQIQDLSVSGPGTTGTATIAYQVGRADAVSLLDGSTVLATATVSFAAVGELSVPVDGPEDLFFEARSSEGATRQQVRIVPGPAPRIEALQLEAPAVRAGQRLRVDWRVRDADLVELVVFNRLERVPLEGTRWLSATRSGSSVLLRASNPAQASSETRFFTLLGSASGAEQEPNDSFSAANAPFGVLPSSTSGEITGTDVDIFAVSPRLDRRIRVLSERNGSCPEDLTIELWQDLGAQGRFGPIVEVDASDGCARIDEAIAPVVASAAGPFFVVLRHTRPELGTGFEYTLDVTPVTRRCGDAVLDLFEDCDDNNVLAGDGCSAACTLEDGQETEPNDDPQLADPWVGERYRGSLHPADVDWIRFVIEPQHAGPTRIQLLDESVPCRLGARLQLYDEASGLRADSGPVTCPHLEGPSMVLEAGVYTLVVSSVDPSVGDARGRYTVLRNPW